jgi:hypothetical protein
MKRLVAIIILLAFVLSLVACGNGGESISQAEADRLQREIDRLHDALDNSNVSGNNQNDNNIDSFATNDPHGLNGRWESEQQPDGRYFALEFNDNRVTQYVYTIFHADTHITNNDLANGGFNWLLYRGDFSCGTRFYALEPPSGPLLELEIAEVEYVGSVYAIEDAYTLRSVSLDDALLVDAYRIKIKILHEATYSISDDGRIEIVWEVSNNIQVSSFQQTENTIDIDGVRYIRQ